MRVPIFLRDVRPRKGNFARIKKKIHKNWPGAEPILLSHAGTLLSNCLGYQSYHQLIRSSSDCPTAVTPKLEDLWRHSLPIVVGWLKLDAPVSQEELDKIALFIQAWPLTLLTAYRDDYDLELFEALLAKVGTSWAKNNSV
ncbi:hypothetical protein [Pseudomonas sp. KCJK9111]|uniref:hypothetical protein n=1 Tax=Pseudomonas sp. KCJK9111 TaxID=3344555 RepID=UPI003906066E